MNNIVKAVSSAGEKMWFVFKAVFSKNQLERIHKTVILRLRTGQHLEMEV